MTIPVSLSMTGDQHDHLKRFLLPDDGKEAVAIVVCGRRDGDRRHRLTVRAIQEIPYEACSTRTSVQVTWQPELIVPILERANTEKLSVLKIHSHPTGCTAF